MFCTALFPGVTITPLVPDVILVTSSTLFSPAAHLSFHVLFESKWKLQTKLQDSPVDLGGDFY